MEIFQTAFLETVEGYDFSAHWLSEMQPGKLESNYFALLQNEIPNALSGNYNIGNYFAVQKSPYAHKALIELTIRNPRNLLLNLFL